MMEAQYLNEREELKRQIEGWKEAKLDRDAGYSQMASESIQEIERLEHELTETTKLLDESVEKYNEAYNRV